MTDEEKPTKQKPLIKTIVARLKTENTLFRKQGSLEPYIAIGKSGRSVMPIKSQDFKEYLIWFVMDSYDEEILNNNQIESIVNALVSYAIYLKEERQLAVRLCQTNDNEIWIDRGSSAIRVTSSGWEEVEDPPILFSRHKHQHPLIKPERGGDIENLRKFINIESEDDWLVFLVYVVSTFYPNIPKPALVCLGPQGSGKSFGTKLIKRIADPSEFGSSTVIKTPRDLARIASRHSILVYDNLTQLSKRQQADFCRLVTGDSHSERVYYTNDEEIIYNFKLQVVMSGLDTMLSNSDALDRVLILRIKRILDEERMTEIELNTEFDKIAGQLLGAILDVLASTLKVFNPINAHEWKSRMSDWTLFGKACSSVMGGYSSEKFIEAYKHIIDRANNEALQASTVAQAVLWLAKKYDEWTGSPTELYERFNKHYKDIEDKDIREIHEDGRWPKDAATFGKALVIAETTLESFGVRIERSWGKGRIVRVIHARQEKSEIKEPVVAVGAEPTTSSEIPTKTNKPHGEVEEDDSWLEEIPF